MQRGTDRGAGLSRLIALTIVLTVCGAAPPASAADAPAPEIPRTVIAVYDGTVERSWRQAMAHEMAELPLNHLGLVVEPHDVAAGLPDLSDLSRRTDVRGVLVWFVGDRMAEPGRFLSWARGVVDSGRRLVLLGSLPYAQDRNGQPVPTETLNTLFGTLGLRLDRTWMWTHDHVAVPGPGGLVPFERPLPTVLPPFQQVTRVAPDATSHLTVRPRAGGPGADVVVTSPAGGYVAGGYTHETMPGGAVRQWLIDPFAFFRTAFATDDLPKPDVTTLAGRRMLLSHVDGDGWTRRTGIHPYEGRSVVAVLEERVFAAYPDMAVTVAPAAADIDPDWCGTDTAREDVRRVFALPQVEPATYSYSVPLVWGTLGGPGDGTATAAPGPDCPGHRPGLLSLLQEPWRSATTSPAPGLRPRRYTAKPFDPDRETGGSAASLSALAPAGKRVALIQWSGDQDPPAAVLRAARRAGLVNLNGGNGRFDPEFPSVSHLSPVGRSIDGEWQVYAPAAAEDAYTNGWTERFHAFATVERTFDNSGTPRRLKPVNVHYHAWIAEQTGGLNALLAVLTRLRRQELIPVRASTYAAIADGFFRTRIVAEGSAWRVLGRGALQTVRFDSADGQTVDLDRSQGVIGARHALGSLYVALDPDEAEPVIALGPADGAPPGELARAVLEHSRWAIRGVRRTDDGLRFVAEGFGAGDMVWRVPAGMTCRLVTGTGDREDARALLRADAAGRLALSLDPAAGAPVEVFLRPAPEGED